MDREFFVNGEILNITTDWGSELTSCKLVDSTIKIEYFAIPLGK